MHQPCTKLVQITCPNNLSQQPVSSILSTKSYQLTNINHQDNSQICASTNHNPTTHNHHQDQYVILRIYQYTYATYIIHKPCVNNTTYKFLQPCTKYVPIMYQLLIPKYQHHQLYTSCMCQLINYLSQPCTQNLTQPKYLINFIIQIWFVTL